MIAAISGAALPHGLAELSAMAQQQPAVVAPGLLKAQPASKILLPIQIMPRDSAAKNSFVRVRGLPLAAALSDGYAIAPGAWAVPLNALANLNLILPVGLEGRSEITISLVSVEGNVLAEARVALSIEPASTSSTVREPATRAPSSVQQLSAEDRERALVLHAKGQELMDIGNVYAARKIFERSAAMGLAQSALSLAASYDPQELARMQVVGLEPDPAAARHWYERARELGAAEAADRLRRLGTAAR